MMDYLDWRGDLTFAKSPFNEVDNLILAELIYVNFDGIVPTAGSPDCITVEEASKLYFKAHSEAEIMAMLSLTKMSIFLLQKAGETRRFGQMRLSKYVNVIDYEEQKQFCAMTAELGDGTSYIAYRGTDDTIIGWKESFNMSFATTIPAQNEAVRYLEAAARTTAGPLRIGGHSKGGNLAVYAAVKCNYSIKARILEIYNNDGPGFHKNIVHSAEYKSMLDKIRSIVPQSSVVGMMLEHEEDYAVVKSSQNGLMQHDAMSWEVMGCKFIYVDCITQESKLLDRTLKDWVDSMDESKREKLIDSIFYIFESAKVMTVSDLLHRKWKIMSDFIRLVNNMEPEHKEVLSKSVRLIFKETGLTLVRWNKKLNIGG